MSEINANIVVEPINLTIQQTDPGITITPTTTQLTVFTAGYSNPGGNVGELQYNAGGFLEGIPTATFSNGNLSLGNVSNLKIDGGVNTYYLQTDGTGNLTWAVGAGNITGNGVPGGSNTQIQYNDGGANFGGSAGFTFDKSSNATSLPGNLTVASVATVQGNLLSLNANLGNLAVANYFSGDGGLLTNVIATTGNANYANFAGQVVDATQSNITSLGNLTGLTVNGNALINSLRTKDQEIAIGNNAQGVGPSGTYAIAIGVSAGETNQGTQAIAIGESAGDFDQSANSIAIGTYAGLTSQGANSIAIGAGAGNFQQHSNSIILNATGANFTSDGANRFFVKPVRNANTANVLYYNQSSGEISYDIPNSNFTDLTVTGNGNIATVNATNVSITGTGFVQSLQEKITIANTAVGASYNFDLINQSIVYNTANANANITLNFRGNSTVTANSYISNANSVVATFIVTTSNPAYGVTAVNIDGSSRTINWAGNTVPNIITNTTLSYTFTLLKTGSNTYTVLGSQTRYG